LAFVTKFATNPRAKHFEYSAFMPYEYQTNFKVSEADKKLFHVYISAFHELQAVIEGN